MVKRNTTPTTTSRLKRFRLEALAAMGQYLARRPHRSFRLTRRRDYARTLILPGYWSFTAYVARIISKNKSLFSKLLLFYAVAGAVFVGLASQDTYAQLSKLLGETSGDLFSDGWGQVGQSALLLFSGLSGGLMPQLSDSQQIYSIILLLLTWLTTVWLLRSILSGKKPKLRDGLYNSGAPIVSTGIVFLALLVQLLPATIAVIVMSSALSTNLFEIGFMAMLISIITTTLFVLSIYWATSTVLALVVATLPGMYPWQAIRAAGDMVVGRRVRILLRILWMMAVAIVLWVVIVLPLILIVRTLTSVVPALESIPIIPVVIALANSIVIIWSATYVYLLYRKIVEDDAKPA